MSVAEDDDAATERARVRDLADAWVGDLLSRHASQFTRPELLKAIRALSARYVEQRASLSRRSALDSAGKRAAFAAFYAPLHALTVRAVAIALDVRAAGVGQVIDLGCGTGAASIGWALATDERPRIVGVDRDQWASQEASWNWRRLGLSGRVERGDLVHALGATIADAGRRRRRTNPRDGGTALVFGWSLNELDSATRVHAFDLVLKASTAGIATLVVEPVARTATPWWRDWAARVVHSGGRDDLWKFAPDLPRRLADLDEAAGFRREHLGARTLWLPAARRDA